ncbi:unnamed protein product [Owenia fusiformis]|uniref:Uncharacterized protein n=1 Tax=Owenia fusiformis TaxID=6347 RepID=A0A8J1Y4S9_OWEFU|nr:unnamed protein product [Owenia fusiformis]
MPLGMNSMTLRIDYDMLLMLFGLLTLPISNIYKQLTITRLIPIIFFKETTWDSPIRQMWDRVRKYNLTELLTNMIVNGIYLTKGSWKRFIKLEVNDKQRAIYRTTCNTYRRHDVCLNICDVKDGATGPLRPCVWWTLAKMKPELLTQCKTMMRLATDSHDFRVKNDGINSTCFLCDMFEIETLDHFLFSCTNFSDERIKLAKILDKYSSNGLTDNKNIIFNFNGNVTYSDMAGISNIIHVMYIKRAKLISQYAGN